MIELNVLNMLTLYCSELASGGKKWSQLMIEVPHGILSGHTHSYT